MKKKLTHKFLSLDKWKKIKKNQTQPWYYSSQMWQLLYYQKNHKSYVDNTLKKMKKWKFLPGSWEFLKKIRLQYDVTLVKPDNFYILIKIWKMKKKFQKKLTLLCGKKYSYLFLIINWFGLNSPLLQIPKFFQKFSKIPIFT